MGRVIRPEQTVTVRRELPGISEGPPQAGQTIVETKEKTGDSYLDRTAKYIPAEVLGFFLFVNNILLEATKPSGGQSAVMAGYFSVFSIAWFSLILGTVLAPVYIWYVHEKGDAWKINATISCIAFPIWAYAIGAVAFGTHLDGNFASILLATFTAISGLVRPSAPQGGDTKAPADKDKKVPADKPDSVPAQPTKPRTQ